MASVHPLLDAARLLHDLQKVNEIAQSLGSHLDPVAAARQVTTALVEQFDCAFARIWLVEPDPKQLRLVASSGLYTHINGSFARVPMGAYKVGKIAQNRVPFLSNQLPEETWVKDRQWALDNQIQGFAGYPLLVGDRILGVLATFSHHPFAPEFLEVLQVLCMALTVALDAAAQMARGIKLQAGERFDSPPLSDQIAAILREPPPMLVGTERALPVSLVYGFLRMAELLQRLECSYCRLTYRPLRVALEAIVRREPDGEVRSHFAELASLAACLGGTLQAQSVMEGQACQVFLELPHSHPEAGLSVQVNCRQQVLQQAFTHLAHQAGLVLGSPEVPAVIITDHIAAIDGRPALWIHHDGQPVPEVVTAVVDLNTTAEALRQQVVQIISGDAPSPPAALTRLSSREQQVMQLLAEGKRDRNIAQELYISESTVKFHIHNSLSKLNAKNRYQGVYQAAIRGWI